MSNSLKFTSEGEVGIRLKLLDRSEHDAHVRFEVFDTGIGLTQAQINKLFQPFVQADTSTTRKYGGTGLGLSICKELVEKMDGSIGVDSHEGAGSTFWFEMKLPIGEEPIQTMEHQATLVDETNTQTDKDHFKSLSVLVADDNVVNQTVLKGMLQKLGLQTTVVDNGEAAVEECKQQEFDLFFLDCEMPQLDGFATCQIIREYEKKQGTERPLPIIALTAHSFEEINQRCFEAGMDDYLAKPISMDQLVAKIDSHTTYH